MANITIPNTFSLEMEAFQTTSPAYAPSFNQRYGQLLGNDKKLNEKIENIEFGSNVVSKWNSRLAVVVTFDANMGTIVPDGESTDVTSFEKNFIFEDSIVQPTNTPVRDGYTFAGWNTNGDGSGTDLTPNTLATKDVRYYAKWTE